MFESETKAVTACSFCGMGLYEGDKWRNYLDFKPKTGQEAADAYIARKDKALCEDCEKDHPLLFHSHDGIMWCVLKEG